MLEYMILEVYFFLHCFVEHALKDDFFKSGFVDGVGHRII